MTTMSRLSLGGMLEKHIEWATVYVQEESSIPSTEEKKSAEPVTYSLKSEVILPKKITFLGQNGGTFGSKHFWLLLQPL